MSARGVEARGSGVRIWVFLCLGLVLGLGILHGTGLAQTGGTEAVAAGGQLADVAAQTKALKAGGVHSTPGQRMMSALALVCFLGIAYALSWNRSKINWRTVGWGTALQLLFGLLILKTGPGQFAFNRIGAFFEVLIGFTAKGSEFVLGSVANPGGPVGFVFAFAVLPSIIFFSSLMAVGYYLGIVQVFVRVMAKIMAATMDVSGAEALSASANVFVGQTEAPLVVKPFVARMTFSELHALMCGGMATIAGGVMAAYVQMGVSAEHLLSASVMSAPAALVMAKMLVPEESEPETKGVVHIKMDNVDANVIDAAARGASEGLQLALNVGAMLLAFIGLLALVNHLFGLIHQVIPVFPKTLEDLCAYLFYPTAWILGVAEKDTWALSKIFGIKTIVNEFVGYAQLSQQIATLDPRSTILATYVLCGFANFSSIAIQIGGLGTMAPSRRPDIAKLGIWCLIGGTLACYMTAAVAGILL